MALGINYDADVAMAEADLPQTVTISGTDYAACVSELVRGEQLEDAGGIIPEVDLSATIRISVLAAVSIGTRITYTGRQYRVERVNDSPCGTAYRVDCVAVGK